MHRRRGSNRDVLNQQFFKVVQQKFRTPKAANRFVLFYE
ncbi:hypothetical protein V22_06660 [Calycomorphotria hydatis]|uniref:Uncharacterized protein n=1 Tax=Calycomorphotria hydatis TaxID=2528027 RepID=A0A517T4Y8_9PLAN|nr:hypothetical protein V22_06660 [Calycomorphotria hydatis]